MIYLGKQAVGANTISGTLADALVYMGTLGINGDITELPVEHNIGEFYKIISAGAYAGENCLEGDCIFCISSGTTANNADWSILKNRTLTGPNAATANHLVSFVDTSGKVLGDSGLSVTTSIASGNNNLVTSDAVYNALPNNYSFVLNEDVLEINYVEEVNS